MNNVTEFLNINIWLLTLSCLLFSCSQSQTPLYSPATQTELNADSPNNSSPHEINTAPAQPEQHPAIEPPQVQSSSTPTALPVLTTVPSTINDDIEKQKLLPLSWESKIPQGKEFSRLLYKAILENAPEILELNSAEDTDVYCSKYKALTKTQRLNFWGEFFVNLALHESGWHQTARSVERTMGIDPVTHMQIASEGLLQISYQDQKSYNINCDFDWKKDKNYSVKDMRKTIFDPYLNLRCGVKIFALQLKSQRLIAVEKNVYWAVIRKHGIYSKISEISKTTQSLPFCH